MQIFQFLGLLATFFIAIAAIPTEALPKHVTELQVRGDPYRCTPATIPILFPGPGIKGAMGWCTFTSSINEDNISNLFIFDSRCKQIGAAMKVPVFIRGPMEHYGPYNPYEPSNVRIAEKFALNSELPYAVVVDLKQGTGDATSIMYAGRGSGGNTKDCWWTTGPTAQQKQWNCSFKFIC